MTSHPDVQTAIDCALARAVVYRTLSIGFQLPTGERLRQAGADEWFAPAVTALRQLGSESATGGLVSAAARLAALERPDPEALTATYVALFGHTTRGTICACETEYGADNTFHQPQQLADISGYYLAFGLRAATGADVRADHMAAECEFMDFISRKEALYLATRPDDAETLETAQQAGRTFLRDHLARFGRAFASRVIAEDPAGYFGALATVLFELLNAECRRLLIANGPVDLAVRPDVPDDAPMACGAPPELIQIRRRP
jgi:TorA maturation chaperone TorD